MNIRLFAVHATSTVRFRSVAITMTQDWKYHEEESAKSHLDEIVEKVYQQGQRTEKALFTSEIETLNAVIVVLRKLDKLFKLLGVDILPYSLKQELKQVAMEDAA